MASSNPSSHGIFAELDYDQIMSLTVAELKARLTLPHDYDAFVEPPHKGDDEPRLTVHARGQSALLLLAFMAAQMDIKFDAPTLLFPDTIEA